jgi:quercetin dioxygenase-like cupin family protein
MENYFLNKDMPIQNPEKGIVRRVGAHNKELMICELEYEKGAIGPLHKHPHSQLAYVVSGAFDYQIGDKKVIIKKGDTAYVQPDIEHGCVCTEPGILLDIFSPERKDFL